MNLSISHSQTEFPSKIFKYAEGNPKQCLLLIGDSHAMSWVPFIEYLAAVYNATIFLGVQSQGEVPGRKGPIPIHDRISMQPHVEFEKCTRGVVTFMAASNSVYMKNESALMYDWVTLARHWGPYGCFFGFEDVPGFGQIVCFLYFFFQFFFYFTFFFLLYYSFISFFLSDLLSLFSFDFFLSVVIGFVIS
jgi:hypothetical protein